MQRLVELCDVSKGGVVLRLTTVLEEITTLEQQYCEGCLVKQTIRQTKGKTAAHRFCIEGCTVGLKIKFIGSQLLKIR